MSNACASGAEAIACAAELLAEIEAKRHRQPSPIGFYFAKLWYYENLYPLTYTVSALGSAWILPTTFCGVPSTTPIFFF